jgi:hypothetical protein
MSERRRFRAQGVDVSDALADFLRALADSRMLDVLEDSYFLEDAAQPPHEVTAKPSR